MPDKIKILKNEDQCPQLSSFFSEVKISRMTRPSTLPQRQRKGHNFYLSNDRNNHVKVSHIIAIENSGIATER